jgi:hypothetical protein
MNLFHKLLKLLKFSPKKKLIYVSPIGAPTYNIREGRMVDSLANPDVLQMLVRTQGECIVPNDYDTIEDLAGMISNAACDHEFPRIIMYPIDSIRRTKVLDLIKKDHINYPMYEYLEANIVGNDDLNSKTIIYKYGGKTHHVKPI